MILQLSTTYETFFVAIFAKYQYFLIPPTGLKNELIMLTTNPEHNQPTQCTCAKCGKRFMKHPWSGTYSVNGNHSYPYQDKDDIPFLVTLCNDCANIEHRANRIGQILY